jgi:protease-4
MDRNRKILVSILALLALSSVVAIVDIGLQLQKRSDDSGISLKAPKFGPGVGVVRIEGPIEMNSTAQFGMRTGAEAVVERLDELMKNSSIRAVVVRINSPGGTVAATQEIYQKLWQLRRKNIPLVASMADVAASGGYYIASACNVIYANYGTVTGSIGVIAYSPSLKQLFDKLGIKMNVIKSGKFKDITALHRDLTEEEVRLLQSMIDSSYEKFLRDVALGRNLSVSDIEASADGRVMNGMTAKECRLVDEVGTFEEAITKARELSGLSASAPVYDEMKSPLQQMFMNLEGVFKGQGMLERAAGVQDFYRFEYRYIP